jgi:hypothetical protein
MDSVSVQRYLSLPLDCRSPLVLKNEDLSVSKREAVIPVGSHNILSRTPDARVRKRRADSGRNPRINSSFREAASRHGQSVRGLLSIHARQLSAISAAGRVERDLRARQRGHLGQRPGASESVSFSSLMARHACADRRRYASGAELAHTRSKLST